MPLTEVDLAILAYLEAAIESRGILAWLEGEARTRMPELSAGCLTWQAGTRTFWLSQRRDDLQATFGVPIRWGLFEMEMPKEALADWMLEPALGTLREMVAKSERKARD